SLPWGRPRRRARPGPRWPRGRPSRRRRRGTRDDRRPGPRGVLIAGSAGGSASWGGLRVVGVGRVGERRGDGGIPPKGSRPRGGGQAGPAPRRQPRSHPLLQSSSAARNIGATGSVRIARQERKAFSARSTNLFASNWL